jgi:hypothetical protein
MACCKVGRSSSDQSESESSPVRSTTTFSPGAVLGRVLTIGLFRFPLEDYISAFFLTSISVTYRSCLSLTDHRLDLFFDLFHFLMFIICLVLAFVFIFVFV